MAPAMSLGDIQCYRERGADFRQPNDQHGHEPLGRGLVADCLLLPISHGVYERQSHGETLGFSVAAYVHRLATGFSLD